MDYVNQENNLCTYLVYHHAVSRHRDQWAWILAFQNRLMQIVFIYSVTGSSDPKQTKRSIKVVPVEAKPEKDHKTHKDNISSQGNSPPVCLLWLSSSSAPVKRPGHGLYCFTNKTNVLNYI